METLPTEVFMLLLKVSFFCCFRQIAEIRTGSTRHGLPKRGPATADSGEPGEEGSTRSEVA